MFCSLLLFNPRFNFHTHFRARINIHILFPVIIGVSVTKHPNV